MVLGALQVELTVVLGRTRMPLAEALRLGRGAVVPLDGAEDDWVEILANDLPVARGRVVVKGTSVAVEVAELIRGPSFSREADRTIGGGPRHRPAAAA